MILYPKADFKKVSEITLEFLKQNRIKALILDVDNTLIDYYNNLSEETIYWVKKLKENKIKLYILSNTNKKQKVEKISKKLEIPYRYFAKKPLKCGFLKIQKELQEEPEKIAVIGDQLFTDIVGGNRCKMFTILVEPINRKDIWITMWKRPLEKYIMRNYTKAKLKGEK